MVDHLDKSGIIPGTAEKEVARIHDAYTPSAPEPEDALTSIHGTYTLAATPEASEADKLMIDNFLKTLADIALAVASRNGGKSQ